MGKIARLVAVCAVVAWVLFAVKGSLWEPELPPAAEPFCNYVPDSARPYVFPGERTAEVKQVQCLINRHSSWARGHQPGLAVDGSYGPMTGAAIMSVQRCNGVAADGIVGPKTWSALVVQVSQGSTGDAVHGVQEEFQFRNLSGDPSKGLQVDGIFGPKTNAAVRGFQQALGITVDGIVGPLTWRALVSGMLSF